MNLVLVTGLSGSGKTTVGKAFEDLGYLYVANLPVPLLPQLVQVARTLDPPIERVAVVIDASASARDRNLSARIAEAADHGADVHTLFLECSDETLVRRYREVRRSHPRDRSSIADGVAAERALLADLRDLADVIVDTSSFNVHELRRYVHVNYGGADRPPLRVRVVSFGFRYGLPQDADIVFDVRFLPNPHYEPTLREHDGREKPVRDFVFASGEADEMLEHARRTLDFLIPRYQREGKVHVSVAIGCTGGKHRSVALTEALAASLHSTPDTEIVVRHRDVERVD